MPGSGLDTLNGCTEDKYGVLWSYPSVALLHTRFQQVDWSGNLFEFRDNSLRLSTYTAGDIRLLQSQTEHLYTAQLGYECWGLKRHTRQELIADIAHGRSRRRKWAEERAGSTVSGGVM